MYNDDDIANGLKDKDLLGLTIKQARDLTRIDKIRVLREDGLKFSHNLNEINLDRINVEIDNNLITKVTRG